MNIYEKSIYAIDNPQFLTGWVISQVEQISQNALAEKVGVSRTIISHVLRGDYRLRGESLRAFARLFELTDAEIMEKTGARIEGFRRRDTIMQEFEREAESKRPKLPKMESNVVFGDPDNSVIVPIYSIEAAAGMGIKNYEFDVISTVTIDRSILKLYSNNVDHLEGISVRGNSMLPTLQNGDLIFVDRFDNTYRDGLYILKVDGDICVKRIVKLPNYCIRVISDNPDYENYTVNMTEISPDHFEVVARVVMRFTGV